MDTSTEGINRLLDAQPERTPTEVEELLWAIVEARDIAFGAGWDACAGAAKRRDDHTWHHDNFNGGSPH